MLHPLRVLSEEWERNIWKVWYAVERWSEFIGQTCGWMNGSNFAICHVGEWTV